MATYISNQTGNWSSASTWLTAAAGTFSPTAAAGAPPQSFGFDKIVVRGGHIVTYDVQGCFGDQTSTYGAGAGTTTGTNTIASNAIILSGGTLKASRTDNIELTACGTMVIAFSGVLDWGTTTDPLTTNANITLHYMQNLTGLSALSASSNSAGIYMYQGGANISYGQHMYICGKSKLRNTTLATSAANGATVISVVSATGWEVGDKLIIATQAISAINTGGVLSATNIVSMDGNNITISTPLNTSRSAGTCVGNFTSNVNIKSYSGQYPSFGMYMAPNIDSIISINNCRFADIGNGATTGAPYYVAGWAQYNYTGAVSRSSSTGNATSPIAIQLAYITIPVTLKGFCIESTHTVASASPASIGLNLFGSFPDYNILEDIAIHLPTQLNTSTAIVFNSQVTASLKNCTIYKATQGMTLGSGFPNNITFDNVNIDAVVANGAQNYGLQWTMTNSKLRGLNTVVALDGVQNATIKNSIIQNGVATGMFFHNNNAAGTVNIINCTITPSTSAALNLSVPTNRMGQTAQFNIYQLNGNVFDNRRFNYFHYSVSDLTVRKRGITTLKIKPSRTNTPFYIYNTLNGVAGVVQRIKGSLRFDSNYGVTYPPSISFVGAGVNTVFTCASTANVWQDFDLSLSATSTDDILMTITSQSSATNGFVWLDGLPFNPFIQDVRHYGFVFDKVADRTIDTLTTLAENQVSALGSISNLDQLYDASNYWSVTNPTLTSYVDLYNANGTVLDFGNKNIVINNTGTALTYISATNTITLDAPTLSAGTNFDTLKTSGTVTLSTGLISNIDINAPIVQTIPTNLTGVFMLSGTLSYTTDAQIEVEYTNCTMVGVKNDGTAIVTIKRTNSTVSETTDAEITTYAPTLIDLTLQGGYIALYDDADIRQYFQNTDSTLILPANAIGHWSYKIARYGYQLVAGSFTVNPAVGGTIDISPAYTPDTFITQNNVSVVSAYTDLNSTDKIHDYLSYYLTTSTGIDYGILDSESFGVLSFYGNLVLSNTAASVVDYNSGTNTLKLKSSSLNDSITYVVASAFSQDGGNTIGDNLKIRATNIDSEFYFSNVNSIVFYPTQIDRDSNTNAGVSATGTIYRFKYGSTVSGVTLSGLAYSRVTVDSILLLDSSTINSGSNTIDFGTTGVLQSIIANQKTINTGVQKASKLIPHTTNI